MKKTILYLLTSLLLFSSAGAQAQESVDEECWYVDDWCDDAAGFYAKILSGVNFLQDTSIEGNKSTYKTGYIIAASVGYSWCSGLRLEAEYAYRRNAIKNIDFVSEGSSKSGHFQTSSCMANLLWDLPLSSWGCACWCIHPFIGAGVGYDFQQQHSSNSRIVFDQKWNRFSWQLMAGLAYPVFCDTDVTLEYKYHQGGCHFYNHTIGIGLSYKFY